MRGVHVCALLLTFMSVAELGYTKLLLRVAGNNRTFGIFCFSLLYFFCCCCCEEPLWVWFRKFNYPDGPVHVYFFSIAEA